MTSDSVDELASYVTSLRRHLRAANKSAKTIKSYEAAASSGAPSWPCKVIPPMRPHPGLPHRGVLGDLLARTSASTAATRYRGPQQLFKWLDNGGEIEASPRLGMPPAVPEHPVPVLDDEALLALLRV